MKTHFKQYNNLIERVKNDSDILAVFLFGSRARDDNYNDSDIDVCLLMLPSHYTPGELFQKRLDYLKLFNLDIQIFQQLPIYICIRIIKEGKILFCRDENKLYEVIFKTITEFNDFEHIYRDYLREVLYA